MAHSNVQEPTPLDLLRYAPTLPGGLKKPPPMKPSIQRRVHYPSGYPYRRHYVSSKEPRVADTFNNLVERLYGYLFPLEPPNPLPTTPTPAELKQHHNHLRTHPQSLFLFRMAFDEATQTFTFRRRTTPPPRRPPTRPCSTTSRARCATSSTTSCCGMSSQRRLWARGQAEARAPGHVSMQATSTGGAYTPPTTTTTTRDVERVKRHPPGARCRRACQTSGRRGRARGAWSPPYCGLSI